MVVSLGTSDTVFAAVDGTPAGGVGHVFGNPAGGWMRLVCFVNGSLARERVRERCAVTWEEASRILEECDPSRLPVFLPYLEDEISPSHPLVPLPEGLWDRALDSEESRWGGRGASVPSRVEAGPEGASLTLSGSSAVLLTRPPRAAQHGP